MAELVYALAVIFEEGTWVALEAPIDRSAEPGWYSRTKMIYLVPDEDDGDTQEGDQAMRPR